MTHNKTDAPDIVCPTDTLPAEDIQDARDYNYADIYQMMETIKKIQEEDRIKPQKTKKRRHLYDHVRNLCRTVRRKR